MNKKVRIGILGCANIAKKYAIKAFQSIDNSEVVSIASRDYEKAKIWASEFNIKAEESYDSLLESDEIDAVYIPLPIGLHKEWVIKAANLSKHIICEKSLAEDFISVKDMVNVCKKKKVILYENFMCDFHPQHERVLEIIEKGDIGKPFVFRGFFGFPMKEKNNFRYNKELGGGCLNDAGAYTIFMARKIFGREPLSVSADLFCDEKNNVDMRGSAHLDFGVGTSALVAFNFDAIYQGNYSIWASTAVLNVNRAYSIPPDMKPEIELSVNDGIKEAKIEIDVPSANHFELIFNDFCSTILNKENEVEKIYNIYEMIINQAKVLEAIRLSSKENRRVNISEIE